MQAVLEVCSPGSHITRLCVYMVFDRCPDMQGLENPVSRSFQGLENLTAVSLTSCNLEMIPKALDCLPALTFLNVSNNLFGSPEGWPWWPTTLSRWGAVRLATHMRVLVHTLLYLCAKWKQTGGMVPCRWCAVNQDFQTNRPAVAYRKWFTDTLSLLSDLAHHQQIRVKLRGMSCEDQVLVRVNAFTTRWQPQSWLQSTTVEAEDLFYLHSFTRVLNTATVLHLCASCTCCTLPHCQFTSHRSFTDAEYHIPTCVLNSCILCVNILVVHGLLIKGSSDVQKLNP